MRQMPERKNTKKEAERLRVRGVREKSKNPPSGRVQTKQKQQQRKAKMLRKEMLKTKNAKNANKMDVRW